MSANTKIEWTDKTWNPVVGCTRVSPGCEHCYAERMARRHDGRGIGYDGTTKSTASGPRWSGQVNLLPERLDQPLRWQKPRLVFVCSMSDLFHEDVPDEFIHRVFAVMAATPWHTYQVLTKRPERMAAELSRPGYPGCVSPETGNWLGRSISPDQMAARWPLPNVWLGTSVENQETADERIPHLLRCPAAVRFLSCEPLLSGVDLRLEDCWLPDDCYEARERLHWVIVGGESGPGARPMDIAWARDIVGQCADADVACFVKQLGAHPVIDWHADGEDCYLHLDDSKGGDPSEWTEDLRVREMPDAGGSAGAIEKVSATDKVGA